MFFKRGRHKYTIAEIHTYVSDMEAVVSMREKTSDGREHREYGTTLHVMREVLLRMIESLEPEQRQIVRVDKTVTDLMEGK